MDGWREEPQEDITPQTTTPTITTTRGTTNAIDSAVSTCHRPQQQEHIGANDETRERHQKPHYHHHSQQQQQQQDQHHHVSHSPPNPFHQYAYQNFLRRLSTFRTGHSFMINILKLIVIIFVLCLLTKAAMSTTTATTATTVTNPSSAHINQRHTAVGEADADHNEEEDEATKLFYAIDPMTPDPHTSDPYDRPEDADTLAFPGSIWYELSIKYKNAPLSRINDGSEPALCLLSVIYTSATTPTHPIVKGRSKGANDRVTDYFVVEEDAIGGRCLWLHESFRECVLRHGVLTFQKTLSEMCRGSQYWRSLRQTLLVEEEKAVGSTHKDTNNNNNNILRVSSNHREHNGGDPLFVPISTSSTRKVNPSVSTKPPTPPFPPESSSVSRPNPLPSLPSSDSVPPLEPTHVPTSAPIALPLAASPPPLSFSSSSSSPPLSEVNSATAEDSTTDARNEAKLYASTIPTTKTGAVVDADKNTTRRATSNERRAFEVQNTRTESVGRELFKGQVFEAEVCYKDRPPPRYIPPSERCLPPMGPPRRCVGRGAGYGSSGSIPQYPFHIAMPAINFHQRIQQQQQLQVKHQHQPQHYASEERKKSNNHKRSGGLSHKKRNATTHDATVTPNISADDIRSDLNFKAPRETRLVLMPKLWDIAPFLLDQPNGKIFGRDDEDVLRTVYGMSRFCLTHARGGWDCLRYVEAMSMGCILIWYDVHAAGPYILPHLPKAFLKTVVKLPIFSHLGYVKGTKPHKSERFVYAPHKALPPSLSPLPALLSTTLSVNSSSSTQRAAFKPNIATATTSTHGRENPFISETLQNGRSRVVFKHEPYGFYPTHLPPAGGTATSFSSSHVSPHVSSDFSRSSPLLNQTWYWENARRTLEYARRYLTSEAMAAYMLKTIGAENARHVLIISRHEFDSLHHSLIVGLDGLGVNMTIISDSHHRLHTCIEVEEDETNDNGTRTASKKCGCQHHLRDSSSVSSCSSLSTPLASSFSSLSLEELVHRRTARGRDHTTYSHGIPTAHRMHSRHLRFVNTFADLMPLFDEGVTCGSSLLSAMLSSNSMCTHSGHFLSPPPTPRAVDHRDIGVLGSIKERNKSTDVHNATVNSEYKYMYAARAESKRLLELSRVHDHVYRNMLNEGQRQLIEALRTRMATSSDSSSSSSFSSSSQSPSVIQRLPSLFDAAIVTYYGRRVFHQPPEDYLDLLLGTKRRKQQYNKKIQTQPPLEDYTSGSAFFGATARDDMKSRNTTLSKNKSNTAIHDTNTNSIDNDKDDRNDVRSSTTLLSFLPFIQWDRVVAKGRVAVIDHRDTREDPAKGSLTVAEKAFFFSRELRRSNC